MSGVNCITSVGAAEVEWRRNGVCCRDGADDDEEVCREVRATAGVRPVVAKLWELELGPGSENRTRFLGFFGVLVAVVKAGLTLLLTVDDS